jgi:hypothetical protein
MPQGGPEGTGQIEGSGGDGVNYEDAWKTVKLVVKEKFNAADSAEKKIAYGHILGMMEAYDKQNPGE